MASGLAGVPSTGVNSPRSDSVSGYQSGSVRAIEAERFGNRGPFGCRTRASGSAEEPPGSMRLINRTSDRTEAETVTKTSLLLFNRNQNR